MFIKVLYCDFIRPILEYDCVVWNSHSTNNSRQLQQVQRKFLRFASLLFKIPSPSYNYDPAANTLGLSSLAERKHREGIRFIEGPLNGKVESSCFINLL